jgi:hypothetical protein
MTTNKKDNQNLPFLLNAFRAEVDAFDVEVEAFAAIRLQ